MKTKKIHAISFLILVFGILLVGCSDNFYDVNDNPNDPSISTPGLTLPAAQEYFASLNATTMAYMGNMFVYNWSKPSNWSANQDYMRYNITTSFNATIFETSYVDILKNLTYVETYEDPTGAVDYSAYKAISAVLKGFQYQLLVDIYGDIPYSEANLRGDNPTPAYDDAETIYKDVIDKLTAAAILAGNLPENAENPGDNDIIFGGDMDKWAQFANTVKLRMLVRLSNTGQSSYINEEIAKINANGHGFITEDVSSNPGYSNDLEARQSPFYGYFFRINGSQEDRNDFTVASDYTIAYLTDTNDPRLGYLYNPSANNDEFKGSVQAVDLPGTGFTSNDLSKVGTGLLKEAEQDQIIMSLSEALLIQAEAVANPDINLAGNAQALYEEAIVAHFEYLGVEDASTEAATYYGQNIENVGWVASSDKIEAIITQKWIALNGIASIESWIDLTRTGFPEGLPIPVDAQNLGRTRPVRLLYPQSELSRNANNVPSQSASDAFNSAPFWK
ncbi:SusD/RagB family nutrient-binding outer membrane lipoprotein [Flagellimonas amoyensis]|uniref:SusD/RagB family nutrient-binding outer membrane lipoprotein n=1 Tax=Flagellimonas amoyensis TaxID=2169401 RepID=UPI000D3539C3|nr:SusD/RagB family nutrient-binding outer membrane lipoprotein [Allomuricauda amoyensis]